MTEAQEERRGNGRPQESLTENAYNVLRSRILQGLFHPEEALLEEHLSASLGMSRTPVRTALTKLKSEGLLVEGADRALHTPKLDRKTLMDTFYARIAAESTIVEIVAAKADDEEIHNLEHLVWSEGVANGNRDESLAAGLDRMFHAYLAEIADNLDLAEFSNRLNAKTALMLSQTAALSDKVFPYFNEHRKIVDAVRKGNSALAGEAMRDHLHNVMDRIEIFLPREIECDGRSTNE